MTKDNIKDPEQEKFEIEEAEFLASRETDKGNDEEENQESYEDRVNEIDQDNHFDPNPLEAISWR